MADKFKAVTFKFPVDIVKKYTEKSGDRVIEGYCVTNDLDLAGDVITDDAMKGAEKDLETNSTVLYNHDLDRPIGKVVKSKLDKKGLYIKIVISKSEDCEPIWEKVEEEIINKFSVRLRVLEKKEEFVAAVKRTVNFIKKMMLLEVSLVTVPMNPEAKSIGWYIAKSLEIADNGGQVEMKENKEAKKATEKVVEEKKEIDVAAATEKVDEKVEEKKEEVVVEAKPEEKVEEKVEEKKEEVVVEAKPEEKVDEKKEEVVPAVEKTEEVVEEKVEAKPEEKAEEVVVEIPAEAAPEATKTEEKPEEKKEPIAEVPEEKETTSKSTELVVDILKKSLKTIANEDERKTITDVIETLEPKKVEEKVVEKKIEEKETTVEDEKKSMTDILKEMREETKTRLDTLEESFSPASIKGIVEDVISEIPGINGTRKGVTVDTEADKKKSEEEAQKLYDALPLDVRMKAAITLQEAKNK